MLFGYKSNCPCVNVVGGDAGDGIGRDEQGILERHRVMSFLEEDADACTLRFVCASANCTPARTFCMSSSIDSGISSYRRRRRRRRPRQTAGCLRDAPGNKWRRLSSCRQRQSKRVWLFCRVSPGSDGGAAEIASSMFAWVVLALVVPPGRQSGKCSAALPTPSHNDRYVDVNTCGVSLKVAAHSPRVVLPTSTP